MTSTTLCLGVAVWLALVCNMAFAAKAAAILQAQEVTNWFFVLTLPLVLVALLNVALLPLSFRPVIKPALMLLVLLSAVFNYASYNFGVIFDRAMFTNILETDTAEALSYLNPRLAGMLALTGVVPAILVALVEIRVEPVRRELLRKAAAFGLSLAVIICVAAVNFDHYAVIGRNNKSVTKLVVPLYPLKQLARTFYARNFATVPAYKQIATDARLKNPAAPRKKLLVMLLGETQRAMNYSLNGYARDTNAFTAKHGVVSFKNVSSYGTSTAVSVPYIFSMASAAYDDDEKYRDNVLDVVSRAGVKVLWRDNDSGCKNACKGVDYADLRQKYKDDKTLCAGADCYDAVFNAELKGMLPALPKQDTLVVFHLEGAHGPSYWERYPAAFRHFTPDCPRSDIQNCSREALVNTYDNTIRYSDHVIAGLIDTLAAASGEWDTSLVFLSDHGESLGENGLYLHSFPRRFAPAEQTQVPLVYWRHDLAAASRAKDRACLLARADGNAYDRINMADTLLGLMDVETTAYTPERDLIGTCMSPFKSPALALTGQGAVR